jgi:hypothetical protein
MKEKLMRKVLLVAVLMMLVGSLYAQSFSDVTVSPAFTASEDVATWTVSALSDYSFVRIGSVGFLSLNVATSTVSDGGGVAPFELYAALPAGYSAPRLQGTSAHAVVNGTPESVFVESTGSVLTIRRGNGARWPNGSLVLKFVATFQANAV